MSGTELPFVSIVVPMLNEERYVADCLASLLVQGARWADGASFEILVMDGGSTDRTREKCRLCRRPTLPSGWCITPSAFNRRP